MLVDYFGREITDAIVVCGGFRISPRPGGCRSGWTRMAGGSSRGSTRRRATRCWTAARPNAIRGYRSETELRYLVGTGVSAAAIWRMREALDDGRLSSSAASSPPPVSAVDKCRVMADAAAPIDVVGTGSFLPEQWNETYATADIVEYDGVPMVKLGREFLLRRRAGEGSGRPV